MYQLSIKRQLNGHYCGPAVMQAILSIEGISLSQHSIAKRARTTKEMGTSVQDLVRALRSWGFKIRGGNGQSLQSMKRALRAGKIAIICYTEPKTKEGHWAILAALTKRSVVLHDSLIPGGQRILPTHVFQRLWEDPYHTHTRKLALYVS